MKIRIFLALAMCATLIGCGEEQPKVSDVTIIPLGSAGTGCPNSVAQGAVKNDGVKVKPFGTGNDVAGVRIFYDDLLVEKNANTTTKDSRKFCEVKFKVRTNDAWQFRVERSMWLGVARLFPEHRLDINYSQRFGSGGTIDSRITHSSNAQKSEKVRLMTTKLKEAWSDCAAAPLVSVKSSFKITGDGKNTDNLFDLTPPGSQTLLLRWRKCSSLK